ncbi:hypothetical protein SAMN03159382_00554 [Pseudomonas sp. NFACC23-1]|uniref:hypothetical protein n=1 Tax=unclassified Pseudomonas TaxID=196821 RepID=UPI00087E04FB|nr:MULTISPECIES: hypothetical protein [unclassified Pseudomonas]SDB50847.1 hypothetical protein SAMN03159386_03850 [Pseudomonas sp. NFACC17-2]SEI92819.1 hypothetical protein SAMN03159382_00554 [Pseudomonas sp. NFACC23-1]SFW85157.1 hypothetical protein SAMN05660640_04348 [Pseudomonas sp. NFACC16-2]
MKLYSPDGSELMQIQSLERDGDLLLLKGTAFGAMPIVAQLRPEEMRGGLRLLNFRLATFLISMLLPRRR